MYNKIYNPQTRGWVDINSHKGKIVLQQYVMEFMNTPEQTGGTTWSDLKKQKKRELDIKHAVHRERISHIQDHALKAQIDLVEDPSRCAERLLIAEREKAHLEEEIKILQLQLKEYSTDKTPKAVLLSSSVSCKTKMGDDGFLIDEPEGCSPQVAFLKAEREAAVEAEATVEAVASKKRSVKKKSRGLFDWLKKKPASINPAPEVPAPVVDSRQACDDVGPAVDDPVENYQQWLCRCKGAEEGGEHWCEESSED